MTELILDIERHRKAMRLSQAEIAELLHVTQGHYSKVISGKVILTNDLSEKMRGYLSKAVLPSSGVHESRRVLELLGEIKEKCIEIMQVLSR